MGMNRRDALKTIGGLAGAATLGKFLPGCNSDGNPVGITTYVYLMLENRTFDHVFGARKLMGMPGDGLVMTMSNRNMAGTEIKVYEAPAAELCVADPPHSWDPSHRQFNNGAMDGFVTEYEAAHGTGLDDVMQYLTRTQIPVTWALADQYTICDRWFASVMGPTLPNRAYWHCASSFGLKANNDVLTMASQGIPEPSIYNRLVAKNVDWAYYSGPLAVAAFLANPGPYQVDLGPDDGTGNIRKFCAYSDMPDDPNGQFFKDAKAGKLPPVCYIDPFFSENDDHPPLHPIMAQALIAAVYNALAQSPQWNNCMLVITYDEHGGFFDHVPPPGGPSDPRPDMRPEFQQRGFRVPAMVIGPYAKQQYVSSVEYDHTSALKHLQNAFGLEPLNDRMNAANDLTDCIDMERLAAGNPAPPIELPKINLADYMAQTSLDKCKGVGFRTLDPITEWANENPGSVIDKRNEYDRDSYHRGLVEALRNLQRG
jgi:phospholipase C